MSTPGLKKRPNFAAPEGLIGASQAAIRGPYPAAIWLTGACLGTPLLQLQKQKQKQIVSLAYYVDQS